MTDLTVLQPIPLNTFKPRLYINGFPKSGLHLLDLIISALIDASEVGRQGMAELGTFKWHSWSNDLVDMRNFLWRLSCLERGKYLRGHCGHLQEIEYLMWYANIGHIFVYRDLRDVAVSQAYHITSDDCQLMHAHKSFFKMMSFDDVLSAVIEGIGPYPGVIARWEKYIGWLNVEWVMKIKFEDLRNDLEAWCSNILNYSLYNATHLLEGNTGALILGEDTRTELIKQMVDRSRQTHLSVTYRKGKPKEWQSHFNDRHIELWKQNDPDNWIEQLGYGW